MPTASQIFKAIIQADASGAVRELKKFDGSIDTTVKGSVKKTDKMGAAFKRAGGLAVAAGGAAAIAFGREAVNAASDLEESVNAVNVVFGDAAEGILELGEGAATSLGLSKSEFNGLSVQFSNFAQTMAGEGGDVVGAMEELTTRAADFASVMNLDVAEAARLFQSGLAGETEPLRKFGINLSAAAVEAFAYANGIAEVGDELTDNEKVQARWGLLMESTEKTAGDFANTSESLANQQRILSAEFENLKAEIGSGLVPVLAELIVMMRSLGTVADTLHLDDVFREAFMEWDDFGLSVGRNIRSLGEWAGVVDGNSHALRQQAEAVYAAERAAKAFDMATLDGVESVEEARRVVEAHTDSQHEANLVVVEWANANGMSRQAQQEAAEAAKAATIEYELQRDAIRGAQHETDLIERTLRAKADADEAAAEAAERHRQAAEDLRDEVDRNIDSLFDYEEANLRLIEAENDLEDQAAETTRVINDSEASANDKEQALIDMRRAEIDATEAVRDAAEAYAAEQGASEGSAEAAALQVAKLEELKEQFPSLVGEIDRYINELNRIPAAKTTVLTIERNTVNRTLSSRGVSAQVDEFGNLQARAAGGPIRAGDPYLVGERGPEIVVPRQSGNVLPNSALRSVGGGSVYNISVTAASGQVAPEAVVDAIKKFERRNGAGWRGAA